MCRVTNSSTMRLTQFFHGNIIPDKPLRISLELPHLCCVSKCSLPKSMLDHLELLNVTVCLIHKLPLKDTILGKQYISTQGINVTKVNK